MKLSRAFLASAQNAGIFGAIGNLLRRRHFAHHALTLRAASPMMPHMTKSSSRLRWLPRLPLLVVTTLLLALSTTACQQQNKSKPASQSSGAKADATTPAAKHFENWPSGKTPNE